MKKFLIRIIILAIIGFGYWLIAPLFIENEVNESLEDFLATAPSETELLEMSEQERFDLEMKLLELGSDMPDVVIEDVMPEVVTQEDVLQNIAQEERHAIEEQELTEKNSVSPIVVQEKVSGPTTISTGSFVGADDFHQASGDANIIKNGEQLLLRLEDFDVTNGPDLRVLLSKESNPNQNGVGDYIELDTLKGNKGNQNYGISGISQEELSEYKSVVIYCKPFHVVFGSAVLK